MMGARINRLRRALNYEVKEPPHRPIPGIDYSAQIKREEWVDLFYAIPFIVGVLLIMSVYRIPLFEALLGFWGGYFATSGLFGFLFVGFYEGRRSYTIGLLRKVMLYPCYELEIREEGDHGLVNHTVHLWREDAKPLDVQAGELLSDHAGKALRANPKRGSPPTGKEQQLSVTADIQGTLITGAYRKDEDLLRQLVFVTRGPLSSHEGIRDVKRVYLGVLGVDREVIRISSVVAKRGQDDRLILYLTDSSLMTREVLNLGKRLQAEDPDIFAAERAHVYSLVKTTTDKVRTLESEVESKETTIKDLQQRLSKKDSDRISDPILDPREPEPPKVPLFGRRLKQALVIIAVLGVVAAAFLLGLNWIALRVLAGGLVIP